VNSETRDFGYSDALSVATFSAHMTVEALSSFLDIPTGRIYLLVLSPGARNAQMKISQVIFGSYHPSCMKRA
jgi:hypothetical protein